VEETLKKVADLIEQEKNLTHVLKGSLEVLIIMA